jgi:hypothetical protein
MSAVSTHETNWVGGGSEDFWAHRSLSRSENETEIRAGERAGDTGVEDHAPRDAATLLGGRQDPHRAVAICLKVVILND